MKRLLTLFALIIQCAATLLAQDTTAAVRDSSGALPRLEIPEITIVGKKAIVLPFARKGEVYDAAVYLAPPPDTSLLGDRRMMPLPIGALPRYEEQLRPWRASLSGGLGNYTSGRLFGYVDYTALRWGIGGKAGYSTTQGHTWNSDGNATEFSVRGHSLVATDNAVLRDFRAEGSLSYRRSAYGMYGIPGFALRRTTKNVDLDGMIGSINREGAVLDLSLGASIIDVTDAEQGGDASVSIVSPVITGTFSADLNATRVVANLVFRNSSLNYSATTQSPGFVAFTAGARWNLSPVMAITLQGAYQHASGTDGDNHTYLLPDVSVTWASDKDRVWSFWYKPELRLDGYGELLRANPYLARELSLRPERSPVRFGSTLRYNSERLSLELEGSYAHTYDRMVTLADSGRLRFGYADVDQVTATVKGTLSMAEALALQFHGTIAPARPKATNTQLPMVPLAVAGARIEYGAGKAVTARAGVTYTSKRNVDFDGTRALNDAVLFDGGISTRLVPRTSLSFHIDNIFNTAFQWWEGYSAPGRQFMIEANISLQ